MAQHKVFVADDVNVDRLAPLTDGGIEVVKETGLTPEALEERLTGFDGVIVRSTTKISARIMEKSVKAAPYWNLCSIRPKRLK